MARKTNTSINGKDYFRVTATVGKDADGVPIRKQFYGESKKEAESKRDEYMTNINKGLAVNYDKALFGRTFKAWFENVLKGSVSISTYNRYEVEYRRRIVNSELSSMCITDIRAVNIQAYYNGLLKNCTPKTLHAVHKLISRFFIYCVKADVVIKNPLMAVELPVIDKRTEINKAMHEADITKIQNAVKEDMKHFIYLFAIFTGLREGEILALTHHDIDIKNGTIHVNKTVKYLTVDSQYKPLITPPKTKQSVRTVPILGAIKQLIEMHIKREIDKHKRLGIPFTNDCILFSSYAGTYREAPNLLRMFKKLCDRIGIERYTFHSLRHTFCTILARQGVQLKTASELMGHTDISITARIYTHVDDAEKRRGIECLSTYFD
ncbi:MAG: site-specific integrase [Defluviitaleaceae bacterium]|nr:site-specific integrase [Defluviitaleaceae bacterium]